MQLTHTRLLIDNYRECFLFYRDILGLAVSWGDEDSNYADFEVTPSYKLAIFDRRQMVESLGKNHTTLETAQDTSMLIFRVDSVEETYSKLKDKVSFITEPVSREDWGIKVAQFRDPSGTLIEINEDLGNM
ncbi:VOC family protein [Oceanobacillus halophilus]|uniref:VOC family protein n=1 Tax=Oceanobacillus halophilus TaxID=930130 RepID=A0A495A6F2_9BACI|nr:VOC family protein [Oceanobacillus halophilus]RKQ33921.1 VOC family protein [Oceanobacillus halophilus]